MNETLLRQIGTEYQTPLYVFDEDMLYSRMKMLKEVLGDRAELCYAMKANPFLIGPLRNLADSFEVCSPGEFKICEKLGIPRSRIVLSGVYKKREDLYESLRTYGAEGVYTVESREHLKMLAELSGQLDLKIQVLLRVTSGNQFGMDPNDIRRILKERNRYSGLHIKGLQWYSGTQKKKSGLLEKELNNLDLLLEDLEQETGYRAEVLEYGPGFYVPYFQNEAAELFEEDYEKHMLEQFCEILDRMQFRGKIVLEMGRYIAAECGFYLTKIVDQKVNCGQNYCIVDGGIHHLNYYGQTMAMKVPRFQHLKTADHPGHRKDMSGEAEEIPWNICGSLCTVSDVIVKQLRLQNAEIGDILVFERVGAYSVTEGIYLFLSRDLPQILMYSEKQGVQVLRETEPTYLINSMKL